MLSQSEQEQFEQSHHCKIVFNPGAVNVYLPAGMVDTTPIVEFLSMHGITSPICWIGAGAPSSPICLGKLERWIESSGKYMRLKSATRKVAADIGGCAYFVGSALSSETRPRDVDVRVVLSDEWFEQRYRISVHDWQWEARICEWSAQRWEWYHRQERCGIMIAGACGERTVDLGIIPESLWIAVYEQAPYEKWGAWKPEPEIIQKILKG